MIYTTLVSCAELSANLNNDQWLIIDCRFSLMDSEAGFKAYRYGHIPNARYAHLNNDLSSHITSLTGRHPLPDFRQLVKRLASWGLNHDNQVVVYDDAGGAFAGRLWWLLRALGHNRVAVLDGGYSYWLKRSNPVTTCLPICTLGQFNATPDSSGWLDALQVQNELAKKSICLIDARTPERFRGEKEPIDPVAGHVPGAINRPFQCNLDPQGLFLPRDALAKQFHQLIGNQPPEQVVHMCGSGVTACHNLLAMEHAGLSGSKLYTDSWSGWIRDPNRPVACHS